MTLQLLYGHSYLPPLLQSMQYLDLWWIGDPEYYSHVWGRVRIGIGIGHSPGPPVPDLSSGDTRVVILPIYTW